MKIIGENDYVVFIPLVFSLRVVRFLSAPVDFSICFLRTLNN